MHAEGLGFGVCGFVFWKLGCGADGVEFTVHGIRLRVSGSI